MNEETSIMSLLREKFKMEDIREPFEEIPEDVNFLLIFNSGARKMCDITLNTYCAMVERKTRTVLWQDNRGVLHKIEKIIHDPTFIGWKGAVLKK